MLYLALELAWLLAPLLGNQPAVSTYEPPPDPGPNPACATDMRLVQGDHDDDMERLCLRVKADRCWSYVPFVSVTQGERKHVRVCMDQYEAPNQAGARPLVMKDFRQATRWCEERSKRLCSEEEFETACEGPDLRAYFYGWQVDAAICNTNKPWMAFDGAALDAGVIGRRRKWSDSGRGHHRVPMRDAGPATASMICWATWRSGWCLVRGDAIQGR